MPGDTGSERATPCGITPGMHHIRKFDSRWRYQIVTLGIERPRICAVF
jgi:hypothetical protein